MRFAQEYAIDFNGTAAAKRAGYAPSGAHTQADRLLKKEDVRTVIEAAKAKASEYTGLTKERLVRDLDASFKKAQEAGNFAGVGRIGELLARMHAYIPEPERRVRVIRELGDLGDEELAALAAAERSAEEDSTRH